MNWFAWSLLAALSMSAYMVLARALLKGKGDSLVFTFITSAVGAATLVVLLPLERIKMPSGQLIVVVLIALGLFYGLIDLLFTRARQLEEVAKVSVAIQSGNFWNLIGSFLIFHEIIGPLKFLGIAFIVLANLLIVWQGQRLELSKGIILTLLGTFLYTFAAYADKVLVIGFSPLFYKAALFALEAAWLFIIIGRSRLRRSLSELRLQGWGILLVGPFIALANYFLMRAFQAGGEASRVLPTFGLSLIFSTLGGMVFLGERHDLFKKLLAMGISFVGAYLIQMF